MKRLFALLLCLVMALSLIPAAAAEDIEIVDIDPVGVGVPDDPSDEDLIEIVDAEAISNAKPTITASPKSVTAYVGTTAKFTVKATGADSYQWYYRTSSSGSWAKSSATGAKTATLSIVAETKRNGYQYRCKVTNGDGYAYSSAATLTVSEKPVITTQPASKSAAAGTTVKFTVKADGAESYQWYYRTSSSGSWAKSSATGAKTATLSIAAETKRDGYQYRCKVTNAKGYVYSSAATLTVAAKPTVTTQPLSYTAGAGAYIYFKVKATGAESYQWQYRTSSSGSWKSTTLTGNKTATLTVKATETRDGYQYRCKVSSAAGSVYSKAATLTVSTEQCGDKLTWKLSSSGLLTISGTGEMNEVPWLYWSFDESAPVIKRVTIGNGVTSLGQYAFAYCDQLTSITIPDSVTSIGQYAFSNCLGLTNVTIPDSVTSIGKGAFEYCRAMTSVSISNRVTRIEDYTFIGCNSLASATIPNGVTSIGNYAFYVCNSLSSVTIPNSVTSIGDYAFDSCSALKSVTIPSSVTSIGSFAFSECNTLKSVTIPNSVTSIGDGVFHGCEQLASITVNSGNNYYSSRNGVLFNKDQTKLIQYPAAKAGSYSIPNTVININPISFADCKKLTDVTIPDSVKTIETYAFQGCVGLSSLTIPGSVTYIGGSAFSYCDGLTAINVDSSNTRFSSDNGVLFDKNQTTLILFPAGKQGTYSIPNSTKKINNGAFSGCVGLTGVTIPNSVTGIDVSAFANCSSLKKVVIPSSVTSIGDSTFYGCSALTSVTIPNSVLSIGKGAFGGCSSLKSVTIPSSLTIIEDSMFNGCTSLTSVTIPDSVTKIGGNAFGSCSSLTDVYYRGTETQWGKINIGDYNDPLLNATMHYNA